MSRTPAEVAEILGTTSSEVKKWSYNFSDHLSKGAYPMTGSVRKYSDEDVVTLGYIQYFWEGDPDLENIRRGLNSGEHLEKPFRDVLKFHTPLFREAPDWLHEGLRSGALLGEEFEHIHDEHWYANAYRKAGDALVEQVLKGQVEPHEVFAPILFLYRHSLELYFKIVVQPTKPNHELRKLFLQFERIAKKHFPKGVPPHLVQRVGELAKMDPSSTVFRYARTQNGESSIKGFEQWVDFHAVRDVVEAFSVGVRRLEERISETKGGAEQV